MATKVKKSVEMKRIQAKICAALEEMQLPVKLVPAKDVGGSIGVVLSAEICNGKGEKEPAVIKTTPIDVNLRKNIPITPMIKKETLFYCKILPEYQKVQAELKKKCVIAKCYAVSEKFQNEFLVLEDLRPLGFIKWVPDTPVDFNHAIIAMRVLGRYHGSSLVIELRSPETFEDIKKLITDNHDVFLDSSFDYRADGARHYGMEAFKKFLKCVDDEVKRDKIIKMSNGVDGYLDTLRSLWSHGEKCVIIHGDYWTDNLLFKYQQDIPIDAAIIDFANIRYSSMANDILNYLSTAFRHEPGFRTDYFQLLLDQYYTSISEVLSCCGYNITDICTRQELENEIAAQWFVGLAIAIFMLPFYAVDEDINLQEWWSGELPQAFYRITNEYQHCVEELINDYTKLGFL